MKNYFYCILLGLIFGLPLSYKSQIINPDVYPITKNMLGEVVNKNLNEEVQTYDQAWFKNDSLNQSIVIELATDYHWYFAWHFYSSELPKPIMNEIEIFKKDESEISDSIKGIYIHSRIDSSKNIDAKYFISKSGHKLGENKSYSLGAYGEPDSTSTEGENEILIWNFSADPKYFDTKKTLSKYAIDSFGYSITMIYKNDKLIGRIVFDNIP